MESERDSYIETISCTIMRFLGSVTRSLCEGSYYIASFMNIEKTEKSDCISEGVPVIKETEQRTKIAEVRKEKNVNIEALIKSIAFENRLARLEAEMFVKNFHSPLRKTRTKALEQLKKISKPAATEILKKLLLVEKDPLRIIEILDTLSGLDEESNLEKRIFKDFLRHPCVALRQAAIRALVKYRDEEGFCIISSCLADEDGETRRQALNYLSWFFPDRCVPVVVRLLHDIDNHVRESAVLICGTLRLRESIPSLLTLLGDSDEEIQKKAVLSLRKITGKHFGFRFSGRKGGNRGPIKKWHSWWHQSQTKPEW